MDDTDIYMNFYNFDYDERPDEILSGLRTCCAMRGKYMKLSLQQDAKNPRDDQDWDLMEGLENYLPDDARRGYVRGNLGCKDPDKGRNIRVSF